MNRDGKQKRRHKEVAEPIRSPLERFNEPLA
jgi:hypothetical protein